MDDQKIIANTALASFREKNLSDLVMHIGEAKSLEDLSPVALACLQECKDLLDLIVSTSSTQLSEQPTSSEEVADQSMSDAEAAALLAAMDSPLETQTEQTHAKPEENLEEHNPSLEEEVSVPDEADTHAFSGPEWIENEFQSDPSMMQDFYNNTDELMTALDDHILKLESNPTDKETIECIFRAAHTLKGAAGMFGFKAIEAVMHSMESLFDLVRKEKLLATSITIDAVFIGMDALRKLLETSKQKVNSGVDIQSVVETLKAAASGKVAQRKSATKTDTPSEPSSVAESASTTPKPAAKTENASIRVDLERLDALVSLVGELVADKARFTSIEDEARLRAETSVIGSQITEAMQQFSRHMNSIQGIIMRVRMVPVGTALNKFPRLVRDIARTVQKEIDVIIEGEDAELDKTIVEQLGDPLVHLVRNACDHGIETPEERIAKGKKRAGTVKLKAKQEGNRILLIISDDGKGMDPERLLRKAVEKGLVPADAKLSKSEILNLIFLAGFSTAEKLTELSGRGVGMDVVKKQIQKLKGQIVLDSEIDKGSTITIQLPLTLAIVKSLMIRSRQEVFALPLDSVVESFRIRPADISRVGEAEVIKLRDEMLPLLHLSDALYLDAAAISLSASQRSTTQNVDSLATKKISAINLEKLFIVVVGNANARFGLVVDELISQSEIVIKSMGPLMKKIPCIAGGAVMGKGDVVLVLDVNDLQECFQSGSVHRPSAA